VQSMGYLITRRNRGKLSAHRTDPVSINVTLNLDTATEYSVVVSGHVKIYLFGFDLVQADGEDNHFNKPARERIAAKNTGKYLPQKWQTGRLPFY